MMEEYESPKKKLKSESGEARVDLRNQLANLSCEKENSIAKVNTQEASEVAVKFVYANGRLAAISLKCITK